LGAPLDVLVVRKLGVPGRPELAMGAVAAAGAGGRGVRVLNHGIIQALGISPLTLDAVTAVERRVVERRARLLRPNLPPLDLSGKTVLLVDDGIATGATARAAVRVARAAGASRVVYAAPVGPTDAVEALARECDRVVVPLQPDPFLAVGHWYDSFEEVPEGAVRRLLEDARTVQPTEA
jgi:putative phosphoribosyl transferase